ncbi:MAG: DMT family transporter [Pseudomonadota bacterium]
MTAKPIQNPMTPTLWGLLILLSVLWGGSFFFNGVLVRELPPMTIVFFRVFLAAIALHIWLIAQGDGLRVGLPIWIAFFAMGLLNNVVPFSLIVIGQTQLASGVASIINATTPLFTLVVAQFLTEDERITWSKSAGLIVGFFGVFVLLGGFDGFSLDAPLYAYVACLAAALSYGFAVVFGRRFKSLGIAPKHLAAGQLTASSAMMLPLMMIVDRPWTLPVPSATAIASLLALAVVATAFAYILYFRVLAGAGATNAAIVTFLIPVSAILLGVTFLNEVLLVRHIGGMLLIGCGLLLVDGRLFRVGRKRTS